MRISIYYISIFVLLISCQSEASQTNPEGSSSMTPAWAKNAIWYQIFVERFHNGDPSNDPTKEDIQGSYPDSTPANWHTSRWTSDWYEPDDYFAQTDLPEFHNKVQLRRYGGDLQGVLDKLDYLEDLGITAIYFNPLNDSPSLHKYDARHYRHIDRNFGPDPRGDVAMMDAEIPDDPASWQWTKADSLFLRVVEEAHNRNIRVVMDYSWNHVGATFWAIDDIRQHGKASRFIDWFHVESFDDPATPEDEFKYEGWFGTKYMPVVNKDIPANDTVWPFEGNLVSESFKQHVYHVSQRWMDPNGDGDPSDGVDGFRLDVAAEVPLGFWRDYRKFIKGVNPEAYLVGEVWWDVWPDKLLDPRPFLQGDVFDAIMNYRWYRAARRFFAQAEPAYTATEFVEELDRLNANIHEDYLQVMMNMSASHDAPRLSTSLANKSKYKYQAKPTENPDYIIHKPGESVLKEQKMLLLHQFTYIGAPQIWNGDELGMWGADDPDCRKPIIWPELIFDPEKAHLLPDKTRPVDTVKADLALLDYYAFLIKLRNSSPALRTGSFEVLLADDDQQLLAYSRKDNRWEAIVAFNLSDEEKSIAVSTTFAKAYTDAMNPNEMFRPKKKTIELVVPAKSGRLLINQRER